MVSRRSGRRAAFAAAVRSLLPLFACVLADEALAQQNGCVLQTAGSPQRQVLRCRDGLTIEAEPGSTFSLVDRNRDAAPDAVNLQNRAILIDAPPAALRQGFQVQTPQAIAAVRGTQWVVDVSPGKTAVFVVNGRVSVRRATNTRSVNLGPGEGVDVEPGTAPLVVRRWPAARAAALLARFGR
ncbi:FecR family protein [Microvirga zambiensis]|uniref:FecR family protein n=1 Tax=Microvirga zambiensis TaxID=1402137 RepID=UPI00191F38FB|nr:FecR family protein [Microvirga zambiensis]